VVAVHGGPGARGDVAGLARELGRTCGTLEPFQNAMSVQGQVDELARQISAHASEPVVLVGHSWGAMLSLLFAARHPTRVQRLVLVASGALEARHAAGILDARVARLTPEEGAELRALALSPNGDMARLAALAEKADAVDPLPDDREADDALPFQPELFDRVWREAALMRERGAFVAAAWHVRCPVTVIHGDLDSHPLEGVRDPLMSTGVNLTVMTLERCGHYPWRERHAREPFFAALRALLP
jgi:pimeloyl-ACP methyl ester carboxylesterase